jgi:uncharacterized protein YbjT (DUF2867 family)
MQLGDLKGRPILVLGITGRQGSAVARHLLSAGWSVRGLVRDRTAPRAREAASAGITLFEGNFDDVPSLRAAMKGAYGVFSVQNFWEAGHDGELRHGTNIAEAAHTMGISHFIYSSVGSANRDTGIPHFESKAHIEERIKLLELPYTIVRPVFFMENWEQIARESLREGRLEQPLHPDRTLQQIAVDDIGIFVSRAFEDPDEWIAHEVDIAGDELSMSQVAATFGTLLGRRIEYVQVPMDQFRARAGPELAMMYQWFEDAGYRANISYLRRQIPGLKSLSQFLSAQDWVRELASADPHHRSSTQGSTRR